MTARPIELDDLAIFGAQPLFAEPRHVGRPNIGDPATVMSLLSSVLEGGWLTNGGPLVPEFESRVAKLSGSHHCVAVTSATVGLQLAAAALEVKGEVLMPSFTFVGAAHAMSWIGLRPVFCEVDPSTHTLDPAAVERAITRRTGAILGVHLWGRSDHAEELAGIARRHQLPLLFDAAHALGSTTGLGDVEVLSFHATKVANTAEGGAVLTGSPVLAERLRRMRNFGFVDYDRVAMLGTNGKMSELAAAVGIASLQSFDQFVQVNRRNYQRYSEGLAGAPGVRLIDHPDGGNFHYVVIEVPAEVRDDLVAMLHAENVLARRYFHPGCHRHEPYRGTRPALPRTESLCARVMTLPTGLAVDQDDVASICALLRLGIEQADELHRLIERSKPTPASFATNRLGPLDKQTSPQVDRQNGLG